MKDLYLLALKEIRELKEVIRKQNLLIATLRLKTIQLQELKCMDNKCPYKIQAEGL